MVELIVWLFFASVLAYLVTDALDIFLETDHRILKGLTFAFTALTFLSLIGMFLIG